MSIFSKIKHAFQHLGNDIAKVGKGIAHAAESVGKNLAHDVEAVAKQTAALTNDLVHLRIQKALHDAVGVGEATFKGMRDLNTAAFDVAEKSLENAHLSKGLDKALSKVDKARGFVNDIADRTVKGIGDSVNGFADSSIAAGKAAAHGRFGEALGDIGSAAGNAAQLASDLTPEGLAASAAVATLQKTHLGGTVVDSVVEGALTGGRSGLKDAVKLAAKEGTKAEAGAQAQNLFDKVSGSGNGTGGMLLGAAAAGAGVAGDFHASRKTRHATQPEAHYVGTQHQAVADGHEDASRKGKKKHEAEVDSSNGNGNGSNKAQPNGADPTGQDALLQLQLLQQQSANQRMLNAIKSNGNDDDDDDGDDVTSKAPVSAPQSSGSSQVSASANVSTSTHKKAA
ncbi:hypothetical protein UB44_20180 [Burkholderiaceae bacterium 26]|uniref:Uncharacterized protein n=1 Tax=Ralstonia chuxiongensis TaxID=2957504 RepID=A0AA42BGB8_9RALS|nr:MULTISPECIES: hypothetical protein [Ralstonia]KJJ95431.1 hypothetical protein UB44_20180 [Burkholderiaceae bacterium 26]MCP1171569.1 hypothetical protein [Ralstonia chuxiongensis]HWV06184.1 hypothetical protein [Ralstonia sp.]